MTAAVFVLNAVTTGGAAASGAKLYTYVKGTSTPLPVYLDSTLLDVSANPFVADSNGRIKVYFSDALNYKFVVKTSDGATTLLTADYTASGSIFEVTYASVGNWDALQAAMAALGDEILAAVETVASIDAEVVIVADAMTEVETVADNIADVQVVADAFAGLSGDGLLNYSGGAVTAVSSTGSGNVVRASSPTIVTPTLTTPKVEASSNPLMYFQASSNGTDLQYWSLGMSGSDFVLQTRTDAQGFGENVLRFARTTTDVTGAYLTAPLYINPDANTLEPGLTISSTSPTSGSATGPFSFNTIEAVIRSTLTGSGFPGSGGSATWAGLQISVNAGGASFDGVAAMALSTGLVQTVSDTSTADKNACSTGVSIQASTLGNAYGGSAGATVTATGSAAGLYGHEVNMFLYTGGTLPVRIGYHSMSWGEQRASSVDAAFAVAIPGGGYGTEWGNGLVIGHGSLPFPLHSSASVVKSLVAGTVTDVISVANLTVTGNIISAANMTLTGSGLLLAADGAVGAPSISFKSDTNTGIYSGGSDIIRITCGGTQQVVLTTTTANFTQSINILNNSAIPAGGSAGVGYRFSSTSNYGVFFGSGAPTLAAAQGSLYLRSDGTTTNDRAYINTNGSTTWTALTTAA